MKKKLSSNVSIIVGDEERAGKREKSLIENYKISDFDIKRLYVEEDSLKDIFDGVDYLPVLSEKKLLHVRDCENLAKSDCEKLEDFLKASPPHICILISGKDIKSPLKDYAEAFKEVRPGGLFPAVFSLKGRHDADKLIRLIMDHLKNDEKNFVPVITAAEIYLKNMLIYQRKDETEIIKKMNKLKELDFNLKTGRCKPGHEFEVTLYYLFC